LKLLPLRTDGFAHIACTGSQRISCPLTMTKTIRTKTTTLGAFDTAVGSEEIAYGI